MTSRERVLTSIAHKEPDRVPLDHGSMRSTGVMAIAYNRLKAHLGVDGGTTFMYDLVQQLAQPDEWYLERFHIDCVDLGRAFTNQSKQQPWTLPDGSAATVPSWFVPEWDPEGNLLVRDRATGIVIGTKPSASLYIDQCHWPLCGPDGLDNVEPLPEKMGLVTWAAIGTAPFDEPLTDERLAEIARMAHQFHQSTPYSISLQVGCNLLEWSQFLFGMENTFLYLAGEKRKMGDFLDRLTELHMEKLSRILPPLKGAVDVLVVGDDLGMQGGPQISPQTYKELFLPRHKRIYEHAKKLSGAAIFLHCCGGVYQLIPYLIEAGVEILNPVQTSARYMEPERLKKEFGQNITFWGGGADTHRVLPYGTPKEVRDDVKRRIDVFGPGGGFVWSQVHNVMSDVPPANIEAMLEAAYQYGSY